eukprot:Nk52_evm36s217 gene=Nk52_evmTU36s217
MQHSKPPTVPEMDNEQTSLIVLLELDKKIRSGNAGDMCNAIVCYPEVLDKYPFPTLVNSVVLKLAQVFVSTTANYIRFELIKAFQRIEENNHLVKIRNIDQILKTIDIVMHSNDPIARALTLRVLSSFAVVAHDRKNIQHFIKQSLRSTYQAEADCATFAADRLCFHSKNFSAEIFDQLEEIVKHVETQAEIRLKIVRLIRHMHHDRALAQKAKHLLLYILQRYTQQHMTSATLKTLTHLTLKSRLGLNDLSVFLLKYSSEDSRAHIRILSLKQLKSLIGFSAHHLDRKDELYGQLFVVGVDKIKTFLSEKEPVNRSVNLIECLGVFECLKSLIRSELRTAIYQESFLVNVDAENIATFLRVVQVILEQERDGGAFGEGMCRSERGKVIVVCLEIVSDIICYRASRKENEESSTESVNDIAASTVSLCNSILSLAAKNKNVCADDTIDLHVYKRVATCMRKVFQAKCHTVGMFALRSMNGCLQTCLDELLKPETKTEFISGALPKVKVLFRLLDALIRHCDNKVLESHFRFALVTLKCESSEEKKLASSPEALIRGACTKNLYSIIQRIMNIVQNDGNNVKHCLIQSSIIGDAFKVLFRLRGNEKVSFPWEGCGLPSQDVFNGESSDLWSVFTVARQASCFREYETCGPIFLKLSERVISEVYRFWFLGLYHIASAESTLKKNVLKFSQRDGQFELCSSLVQSCKKSISHLYQSITAFKAAQDEDYTFDFQREFIQSRLEFLVCMKEFCVQVGQLGMGSKKLDSLVNFQVAFSEVGNRYERLLHQYYDIDEYSYALVESLYRLCLVLETGIGLICSKREERTLGRLFGLLDDALNQVLRLDLVENSNLKVNACADILNQCIFISEILCKSVKRPTESSTDYSDALLDISLCLLSEALPLPEYFFVSKTFVSVKMSVKPKAKSVATVTKDSGLMVNLEGIVKAPPDVLKRRPLKSALIVVKPRLVGDLKNPNALTGHASKQLCPSIKVHVPCNRGYFTSSCLLNFSKALETTTKSMDLSCPHPSFKVIISASLIDVHGRTWRCGPKETLDVQSKPVGSKESTL